MSTDKRAYLFRNAPSRVNKTDDALRRNRIYIGWTQLPRLIEPDLTYGEFKAVVSDGYPEYNPWELGTAATRLWIFLREMRTGELVIVAPMDKARQHFYVSQIAGPPRPYIGDDPHIGFERRVKWLNGKQPYLRSKISGRLNHILKERPTLRAIDEADVLRELESLVGGLWYPDDLDETQTYPEGAKQQVLVNKYERDKRARAACIKFHGLQCVVCGFDFEAQYGEAGKDIIHVHHTKPVSRLGEGYRVNPKTDLCPVCPNCHAIIHPSPRRTLSIPDAKRFVRHRFPW